MLVSIRRALRRLSTQDQARGTSCNPPDPHQHFFFHPLVEGIHGAYALGILSSSIGVGSLYLHSSHFFFILHACLPNKVMPAHGCMHRSLVGRMIREAFDEEDTWQSESSEAQASPLAQAPSSLVTAVPAAPDLVVHKVCAV